MSTQRPWPRILFFLPPLLIGIGCGAASPPVSGGGVGAGGHAGEGGAGGSGGGGAGGAGGGGGIACPDPGEALPGPDDPSVSEAKYRRLEAGSFFCGIEEGGSSSCWSGKVPFDTTPPSETFRGLSVGHCQACALDEDGKASCWGCPVGDGGAAPPAGSFRSIAVGAGFICGIRAGDGGVVCSGSVDSPTEERPFTALAAGLFSICGLVEGAGPNVVCWGDIAEAPPDDHAVDLGAGSHHFCLLDEEGEAHCWGQSNVAQTDPPPGPFVTIDGTCGLRPDGTPVCWGTENLEALHDVPPGCFLDIAATFQACALRSDGRAVCWGHASYGDPSPP